ILLELIQQPTPTIWRNYQFLHIVGNAWSPLILPVPIRKTGRPSSSPCARGGVIHSPDFRIVETVAPLRAGVL
ncbi:MAG TPA: hypothetical protein VES89_10395, partial [Candidatus Competibacteraceae bacterium]|nr:hypothetical protein [Candidatus Competibacteraceae bacterium]